MIASHNLPLDTKERVRRRLEPLERFPRLGKELGGRWQPLRMIYGPWPWMFILYSYENQVLRLSSLKISSFQVGVAIRFRRRPHELDVLRRSPLLAAQPTIMPHPAGTNSEEELAKAHETGT